MCENVLKSEKKKVENSFVMEQNEEPRVKSETRETHMI